LGLNALYSIYPLEPELMNAPTAHRPRLAIMTLTEAAASRVREIMANADGEILGVRVGVRNGGCAGMAYTLDYVKEVSPLDEVVEQDGVRVYVDPKALMFLLGTQMDFKSDALSSNFTFNNPNQVSACGCGESVSLVEATLD
jgi:iron-sulfur cluster assembly protein